MAPLLAWQVCIGHDSQASVSVDAGTSASAEVRRSSTRILNRLHGLGLRSVAGLSCAPGTDAPSGRPPQVSAVVPVSSLALTHLLQPQAVELLPWLPRVVACAITTTLRRSTARWLPGGCHEYRPRCRVSPRNRGRDGGRYEDGPASWRQSALRGRRRRRAGLRRHQPVETQALRSTRPDGFVGIVGVPTVSSWPARSCSSPTCTARRARPRAPLSYPSSSIWSATARSSPARSST